jgi:hypothetical protein
MGREMKSLVQMTIALQINKYHLRTFGNGKGNEEFIH